MSTPIWLAVWGMASVGLGFAAVFAFVVSSIWDSEEGAVISATVLTFALFSLFAVQFVQNTIDSQAGADSPSPTTVKEPR